MFRQTSFRTLSTDVSKPHAGTWPETPDDITTP
jgi:hypothetical protein